MISALVLSWNELDIVRNTIRRLKRDGLDVWVVDNFSTDGTREYLSGLEGVNLILLEENLGASVARNEVIDRFKGDYLLMLDSDILYIPFSAEGMLKALKRLPKDAYCLGIHNRRADGTPDMAEADTSWNGTGAIYNDMAIAWTQYGLFKGDLVRKNRFPATGCFYGAGYGYEDDYMNAKMEKDGYRSYYCTNPLYYHKAHTTKRNGIRLNEEARRGALFGAFPDYVHWMDRELGNSKDYS